MTDMTIHAIAGFCNERTLWKLLVDLSSALLDESSKARKAITPEMVMIDGEDFLLIDEVPKHPSVEFYPPEGIENAGIEGLVWSLGAIVSYVSSGHFVFGGRGGSYQRSHPKVALPTLKKDHEALTALVKKCLCCSPSQRISLGELHATALRGLEANAQKKRSKCASGLNEGTGTSETTDDIWPDTMT